MRRPRTDSGFVVSPFVLFLRFSLVANMIPGQTRL